MECKYTPAQKTQILEYIKETIEEPLKQSYQDFFEVVEKRITTIHQEWLKTIRDYAEQEPNHFSCTLSATLVTTGKNELITSIFVEKYSISVEILDDPNGATTANSIFSASRQLGHVKEVAFYWSPFNKSVYNFSQTIVSKRYTYEPDQMLFNHWSSAVRGHKTDILFVVGKAEIPLRAHSQILKLASAKMDEVITAFEGEKKAILIPDCSREVFSDLLQFIYTGKISQNDHKIGHLVALYKMGHEYMLYKLLDHCLDLVQQKIKKGQPLTLSEFHDLLSLFTGYGVQDFIRPCFEFAETVDMATITGSDRLWPHIHNKRVLLDLYAFAIEQKREEVTTQLKEIIISL